VEIESRWKNRDGKEGRAKRGLESIRASEESTQENGSGEGKPRRQVEKQGGTKEERKNSGTLAIKSQVCQGTETTGGVLIASSYHNEVPPGRSCCAAHKRKANQKSGQSTTKNHN